MLGSGGRNYMLPIVSRLVPATGNRNKLTIALVRGLAPVTIKPARELFDAWFMWGRLVLPLLSRKMRVISQARRDTALIMLPIVLIKPGRGRPAKYGVRMIADAILALSVTELKLTLYGKEQLFVCARSSHWRAFSRPRRCAPCGARSSMQTNRTGQKHACY